MKRITTANLAIFILFFGLALVKAVQDQSWIEAGLFLGLGILSIIADLRK